MTLPSQEELTDAFRAGFESIDDGEGFYPGFHAFLQHHGYHLLEDIACTCTDSGAHGHQPECRWVRV